MGLDIEMNLHKDENSLKPFPHFLHKTLKNMLFPLHITHTLFNKRTRQHIDDIIIDNLHLPFYFTTSIMIQIPLFLVNSLLQGALKDP